MLRALARPADRAALRAKAARFSAGNAVEGYERLILDITTGHGTQRRAKAPDGLVET